MFKCNCFANGKSVFGALLSLLVPVISLTSCTGTTSPITPNTVSSLANSSSLHVANSTLPNGTVQTAYTAALTATGGNPPYSWSVSDGDLPPGLSLNSAGGTLTGIPTAPGTFSFTANLQDSNGSSTFVKLSLSISDSATPTSSSSDGSSSVGITTASPSSPTSGPPSQTQSPQSGAGAGSGNTPVTSSSNGSSIPGTTTASTSNPASTSPSQTQSPQSAAGGGGGNTPATSSSNGSPTSGTTTASTSSPASASPSQTQSPQSGTTDSSGSTSSIGLLSLNVQSLSFGSVNVGMSHSQEVVVSNSGTASVAISNVSVSGSGVGASGLTIGLILAPQQTATLEVTFAPAATGAVTGGVVITSEAANATTSIVVSGTGVQPVSHAVDLTWSPSTSIDITGYDVYRGLTTDGPYTMLTTTAATNYTDTDVQSGQTYYYELTAVDSNNVQSAFSNAVSATIP